MKNCNVCGKLSSDFPVGGGGGKCRSCHNAYRRSHAAQEHVKELRAKRDGREWPRPTPLESDVKKFWAQVRKTSTCWLWTGSQTEDKYGRFYSRVLRERVRAHRFSWFLKHGVLPSDNACHTCDTPLCVRPTHLFNGTHADNAADRTAKGRQWVHVGFPDFKGEKNARHKLTEADVLEIRRVAHSTTRVALARKYGVSSAVIGAAIRRVTWQHV